MVDFALWLAAGLLAVPLAVLTLEALAALLPARRRHFTAVRPACAILVPAHDEEAGLGATLAGLLPQLLPTDRILVVADNCTDGTAAVARTFAQTTVVERCDQQKRGKGYALDRGVRELAQAPPAVVVVIDADCRVAEGTIDTLVRTAAATGRPAQATYLMASAPNPTATQRVSAFAFRFKNLIRPRGLARLGLPCLLGGTGMAFPWELLRDAPLASGNIVEDMNLAVDLAAAGKPALFCPEAAVYGELPAGAAAARAQRQRWEHGHLKTLVRGVPRLLGAAVRRGRPDLFGLALELGVPTLAFLALLEGLALLLLLAAALLGAAVGPALFLAAVGVTAALAVFAAWARFGRDVLPFGSLLAAPLYILGKVPIYLAFFIKPQRAWVRTERAPGPPGEPHDVVAPR